MARKDTKRIVFVHLNSEEDLQLQEVQKQYNGLDVSKVIRRLIERASKQNKEK